MLEDMGLDCIVEDPACHADPPFRRSGLEAARLSDGNASSCV